MSESMEMPAKIRLMYYLWKKGGHKGSKKELAEELGYADETTVLKHLKALEDLGYVKEKMDEKAREIRLTGKGQRKILLLTYPRQIVRFVLFFGLAYFILGAMLYAGLKPNPVGYMAGGIAIAILSWILARIISKMEKELFSLGD